MYAARVHLLQTGVTRGYVPTRRSRDGRLLTRSWPPWAFLFISQYIGRDEVCPYLYRACSVGASLSVVDIRVTVIMTFAV